MGVWYWCRTTLPSEPHRQYHSLWCRRQTSPFCSTNGNYFSRYRAGNAPLMWQVRRCSLEVADPAVLDVTRPTIPFLMSPMLASLLCLVATDEWMTMRPSQAKVLTGGGDLRFAQVTVPLSVSHSCVWPHRWAVRHLNSNGNTLTLTIFKSDWGPWLVLPKASAYVAQTNMGGINFGWLAGFWAQTGSVAKATFVRRLGEAAAPGEGSAGRAPT